VSGASLSGLATGFWLHRLGYAVTIVEAAPHLRRGGTAVNIQDECVDVVRRMGLLDDVRRYQLSLRRWEFKNADDVTERTIVVRGDDDSPPERDIEIERDVLLDLLFDAVEEDVDVVFGDSVAALNVVEGRAQVTFARAGAATYDVVIGCDGMHSGIRRLCFGPEAQYSHFMGRYYSVSIVDELLIERGTMQMFNVPGRAVMLNAYQDKTDVIFVFATDDRIPYDRRDQRQQQRIIAERFANAGWRTVELLAAVNASPNFYFDELAQIRMPSWSTGPVALVGDAGYCASPAAGQGGSLALGGAAALAAALEEYDGQLEPAFRAYERRLRPLIEGVQEEATRFGLDMLVPMTEEAIRARNDGVDSPF